MKKTLLFALSICCICLAQAQTSDMAIKDSTLQQYVGNYTFPEGSFVTSAEISIKDNMLYVNSTQGSSPLERKAKDTFALTNYDGMAYFFRNADGKVARIKVEVGDILLDGTKAGVTAWLKQHDIYESKKQLQVK